MFYALALLVLMYFLLMTPTVARYRREVIMKQDWHRRLVGKPYDRGVAYVAGILGLLLLTFLVIFPISYLLAPALYKWLRAIEAEDRRVLQDYAERRHLSGQKVSPRITIRRAARR